MTGLEVVPLAELGPPADRRRRCASPASSATPSRTSWRCSTTPSALVAGLDEPAERNYVARARARRRDRLAAELGDDAAWRRATTRIFGSKPGAYGAGLLPLIDARDWRDDADLAEVYVAWGGYAYGRGLDGARGARGDARALRSASTVAVKNQDNREHDIFDSDDYFQYHGGMVADGARADAAASPRPYVGDSADPDARAGAHAGRGDAARLPRRVVNPRWIAAMQRHGYKGAFELAATVDYLFGYDATAGVVEDWMYEQVDRGVRRRRGRGRRSCASSNPWALRAIAERLLEAAERGLWDAAGGARRSTRARAPTWRLEGELEEAAQT